MRDIQFRCAQSSDYPRRGLLSHFAPSPSGMMFTLSRISRYRSILRWSISHEMLDRASLRDTPSEDQNLFCYSYSLTQWRCWVDCDLKLLLEFSLFLFFCC
jgi:hypothetical protein